MKYCIYILSFLALSVSSTAKTLHVGKGQIFNSISQALAVANNGDVVLVETGIYHEKNLIISKSIILRGLDHPVLDGEHKYEIISIKANDVTVDGFKVIHSGVSSIEDFAGIKIYNSRNVIIKNNILEDTFFGIYSQYGTNCTIENNQLTAYGKQEQESGNGIHCWKSDSLKIIANTISGHRDGIYFEFVTNSVIWRNTSFKNLRYGLHFMFSNSDSYITNIFKNNGAGVAVMFSSKVKMFHNYFEENWGDAAYGLLLKEISDSYIDNNRFVKNTTGIHMEGASRITMTKNVFEDNGWALKIQASCMDITLNHNNFISNTFDVGTNGSLVLNTFDYNYWDKYDGYDLNKDKIGDIPYRPVSMYSMIVEQNPTAMMLFRSFMTSLLDKTEKILPTLTPEGLKDNYPLMKALPL
ncbi:nitrous oxide reductase family maturation protein NosD [Ferruginibacter lapsinanis]|uniref:nitrous oxide reductase family maturation protein NosD n=1 Tax=Ferruginibacter lapsinanis TaxID=563172 RepID=UPI001E4F3FB4|nr:nitrous oxide reductase family maturation protein NosD [Ferruginibacter lapsinanis]UEG50136.1 nitrous oxide reductase family maturation protein NosD [Ferruginibacter lapsinanis]